jgi:membrane-bound serine protease (ClpP class)
MLLASGLLIIGIAVILLEFFIPSFGLIGVIGAASVISAIVIAFRTSNIAGSIFLIASLIIVPVLMLIFFKIFPRTYFGKKLILGRRFENYDGFTSYTPEKYEKLLGISGIAETDLRPSGMILIEDRKLSAVTSGEYIEKGKPIVVIKIEGSRIVIRQEV